MRKHLGIVLALLVGALIVGGGYALLRLQQQNVTKYDSETNDLLIASTSSTTSSVQTKDTDSDGLADWEEVLWKTDSQNPDTDGDGATDGAEARANRNPLIKGPNDTLIGAEIESRSTELTPTQKLTRDIFIAHEQLKQAGEDGSIDPDYSLEAILERNATALTPPNYQASDFTQVPTTAESLQKYGGEIQSILSRYMDASKLNEISLMQKALENEDAETLGQLKKRAAEYEKGLGEFLSVSVPKNALSVHIGLTNSFGFLGEIVKVMSDSDVDPLTALSGLNEYPNALLSFLKYLKDLQAFFK